MAENFIIEQSTNYQTRSELDARFNLKQKQILIEN